MDGSGPPTLGEDREMTAAEVVRKFSEVQAIVMGSGPVVITRHGKPAITLVRYEAWRDSKSMVRQKLTTVLNELDDAYLSLDRDWRITTLNRAAERYFGVPVDAVIGIELGKAFPPITGTEAEGHLRHAMEQGEVIEFPWKSVLHAKRNINVRVFPLHREEGGVGVLFSSAPEEQRLGSDLTLERKRLAALLNVAGNWAVIDIDRHGIITGWSEGARDLLGWSAQEAVGEAVDLIYTRAAQEAGTIWREMAFAHRDGRAELETVHVSKSGIEVPCLDVLVPVGDAEGRFLKVLRPSSKRAQPCNPQVSGRSPLRN